MLYGLKQRYLDQMKEVFNAHAAVEKVILYGSRAKGDYRKWSDIDLTFIGNGLTLSLLMKIETELDDLLMPYKIDASIYTSIENEDLVDHINRVGAIFYEKTAQQEQ